MLSHFVIVLRPLRSPKKCKRFFGFACCHSEPREESPGKACHSASPHSALLSKNLRPCRLCLLSFRACRGIPWKGTILKPARGRSKAFPFPHGVSPVSVPLIAMQQGIHGKPSWAGTLSVSQSGAFSYCVTRFRGGALRHAKFPKTSYKVQLLDTL